MSYLDERRAFIAAGRPLKQKQHYIIPKVSKKRREQLKKCQNEGSDNSLDSFFSSLRPKMKNKCLFCNAHTMKNDDEKFHFSLAHLLPKNHFKSVATNPANIIELCFWNNSCHSQFDNGRITWEFIKDSKEWEIIKEQLLEVLPLVAPEERKHKLYSKLVELVNS